MVPYGVAWIGSLDFSGELSIEIGFPLVPWVADGESGNDCSSEVFRLECSKDLSSTKKWELDLTPESVPK